MRPQAHVACGYLVGRALGGSPRAGLLGVAGANLPDLDYPLVMWGRARGGWPIHHRWPTHALMPWAAGLAAYARWGGPVAPERAHLLGVAVLSHLAGDLMADRIRLAWPAKGDWGWELGRVPAASTREWFAAYRHTRAARVERVIMGAALGLAALDAARAAAKARR